MYLLCDFGYIEWKVRNGVRYKKPCVRKQYQQDCFFFQLKALITDFRTIGSFPVFPLWFFWNSQYMKVSLKYFFFMLLIASKRVSVNRWTNFYNIFYSKNLFARIFKVLTWNHPLQLEQKCLLCLNWNQSRSEQLWARDTGQL